MRKIIFVLFLAGLGAGVAWWTLAAPSDAIIIAPAYVMGEAPAALLAVSAPSDFIGENVMTLAPSVPGYDEIILQEKLDRAFVMAGDGWIWKLDLTTGAAERFVDAPLMPAGARMVPGDDDRLCFCSSYLYGESYPEDEQPGVYELKISTREITPLLTRVPLPPPRENWGIIVSSQDRKSLAISDMNEQNSRAIAFCNDLDITADGDRIYFSEPFAYEGASMGGGAIDEAISLGNNGRLWMLDRKAESATLIAQNYTFIDGVLIENPDWREEKSVLVAEATKFRVLRLHISGEKAGQEEVLWENLPGVPDGFDRDAQGRIWLGLLKERSPLLTWSHANPWIKPLMLRLPLDILPVPEATGFMGMSADASEILFYTKHDGARVHDISVVVPGAEHLYLACFNADRPGIHRVPYPPLPE